MTTPHVLNSERITSLSAAARRFGTPTFVYFPSGMRARLSQIETAFQGRFEVSFAMKCNPNVGLLKALRGPLAAIDASSAGEIYRGLAAGFNASQIAFSGPAKREFEIEYAVSVGCGSIVCESLRQIDLVDSFARKHDRRQSVLIRVNPKHVPRKFGLQMGGRASQFGIDEEDVDDVIRQMPRRKGIELEGLHAFSAGNSLDEDAIIENFECILSLFKGISELHGLAPRKLVIGSGFGIPYFVDDRELDLHRLAMQINPLIDDLTELPAFAGCRFILEMGRWLVGPDGYLLTSIVDAKTSRGTEIRLCDAGFNNHLSACGMMGTVMRRNWRFWNLSRQDLPATKRYLLVGPLCASFDVLGTNVDLPVTEPGDVLAVGSSGAYGLTASPTRFISHPEPRETLAGESGLEELVEVTESALNFPGADRHGDPGTPCHA